MGSAQLRRWIGSFLCIVGTLASLSFAWATFTEPRFDREGLEGEHPLVGDVDAEPLSLTVQAGGELVASELRLGKSCRGYMSKESTNVRVYFEQPEHASIEITLESEHRNALIVNGPDGAWHCVRSSSDRKSVLVLDAPNKGQIDIWAANFSEDRRDAATLTVRPIVAEEKLD